jgi:hypothetical protein
MSRWRRYTRHVGAVDIAGDYAEDPVQGETRLCATSMQIFRYDWRDQHGRVRNRRLAQTVVYTTYTLFFSRLIALMLGRLRMSVSDTITHYDALAKKVFSDGKKVIGDGHFKGSVLRDVVKEIVKAKTADADSLMMEADSGGGVCKTYVDVLSSHRAAKLIGSQFRLRQGCRKSERRQTRSLSDLPSPEKCRLRLHYMGGGSGYVCRSYDI